MSTIDLDDIDINRIISRPLYFALLVNVVLPMAGLFFCYYQDQSSTFSNTMGDFADIFFYLLCALALGHAAYGLWWRFKLNKTPMVRRVETFEEDISDFLNRKTRPIFLVVAAICLYGFLFFVLTGRFNEVVFLVFFSFIVFQVVRPRYGMIRKILKIQSDMVDRGEFRRS